MQPELEEVFVWLEAGAGADYQAGVLLLQKHSKNRSLSSSLLRKESDTNRAKLVYELIKVGCGGRMQDVNEVVTHFAQAVPAVAPLADVALGQNIPAQPESVHVPAQLRPEVEEITQQLSKVYTQRCQLSNSLAELDPAQGPTVVPQILALEQEYHTLAQKRRNLEAGGEPTPSEQSALVTEPGTLETFTPATEQPTLDRAALVLKRNTLRSNISKAKKKAEESKTESKRSEYAQKAGYLAVELALVESQLQVPQVNL